MNEELDKLDQLAAVKIMGWALDEYMMYCSKSSNEPVNSHPYWRPTRDIRQAWEVLEKFDSYSIIKLSCSKKVSVMISAAADGIAETAPHAIVLACLKAVSAPRD